MELRELVRTNDLVLISAVGALLDGANIHHVVLDQNMSIVEGSLGLLQRRILVNDEDNRAARRGMRVVDFGAGVGAAGLAVACRVDGIDLALVEIDETLANLARSNAAANSIAADVIVLDVEAGAEAFAAAGLAPDSADAVLMNPPFNDSTRHR